MTGFKSKRDMAEDKLLPQKDFGDALTIAYQSGYYDGKKAAQPAQEPFTYRSVPHGHCTHPRCKEVFSAYIEVNKRLAHYEPKGKSPMILNAAPPQRTWVGLTDDEVLQIRENLQVVEGISLLENLTKAIEAKLKEKNT